MLVSEFMKTIISTNQTALSFDYSRHEAEYKVSNSSSCEGLFALGKLLRIVVVRRRRSTDAVRINDTDS